MLYQVHAYDLLDGLQVQVVTADTSAERWSWQTRVLEFFPLPDHITRDPWDVLWFIGQELCNQAIQRSRPPAGS